MALEKRQLFGSVVDFNPMPRIHADPNSVQPKRFASAAGAPLLALGTPLARVKSTGLYRVWSGLASVNEVQSVDLDTPSAGTFTLAFDGEVSAAIAFNANAAAVQAALEALSSINPGDVVVTGGPGNTTPFTVTFGGRYAGMNVPALVLDASGLTGAAGAAVTTSTAGVAADGADEIAGFVYPDPIQLSATGETIHSCLQGGGAIHRDDIPLPAGESQSELDAALRSVELQKLGFRIQGLSLVP